MILKHILAAVAALGLASPTLAQNGQPQDRFIVVLKDGAGPPEAIAEDIAARTGGRIGFVYRSALRGFSITMPRAALNGLRNNPDVAHVEEDIPVTAFPQSIPTGLDRIFADPVSLDIDETDDWRVDADVAVLDTGIDYQHTDLHVVGGANCLQQTGSGPWWKRTYYCDEGVSSDDDHYHGTHVAGTIGALDNGFGVVGVAPGARLWAVKVLDGGGSGSMSGIIAGVDWVTARGDIEVINMSLGGAGSSAAMDIAVANAVAGGVTVVVAAGNSDANAANYTPANAPDAITVSALADFDGSPGGFGAPTCRTDQDDTLADFSNWGAVDIAAPGVCIYSTYPLEFGGYSTISGTSMAAPHVAGAAALLASRGDAPASIRATLLGTGNLDWLDDSPDGVKEPLLDISDPAFIPDLVAGGGGGGNTPPVASFTIDCSALTCEFDASGSTDDDGDPLTYSWDFGDGSTGEGVAPTHTYAISGFYYIVLTVNDGEVSDIEEKSHYVDDGGPVKDACDGRGPGVHLTPGSINQGKTWMAEVVAVNCDANEDETPFDYPVAASWSPDLGGGDCEPQPSDSICLARQPGVPKKQGSVQVTILGVVATVNKP